MEKEKTTKEKLEKIERIENLIDYVMEQNFCEDDTKTYLHYLDNDLEELQKAKDNCKYMEDECLFNHCIEQTILLQQIIEILKGVEE